MGGGRRKRTGCKKISKADWQEGVGRKTEDKNKREDNDAEAEEDKKREQVK
jgi:hypothetical protein